MSKEQIIKKLLEEKIEPGIKYHSPLPGDIAPWYVYTGNSGHRILCVLKKNLSDVMTEDDYHNLLVSAPVKTVLRGYSVKDSFIIIDSEYTSETGFDLENEDREFEAVIENQKYALITGELYHPGVTNWPEAVEYNFFSNRHELRFILKNPSKYVTEVIRKMPLQLGLFTENDIILLVYKFTDYKKHIVPVHGYSPFSIHLVPDTMRTLPVINSDIEYEAKLHIHLVDAENGILKAARTVELSKDFTLALNMAIIEQSKKPVTSDYNTRLQLLDSRYPDNDSLMDNCKMKSAG